MGTSIILGLKESHCEVDAVHAPWYDIIARKRERKRGKKKNAKLLLFVTLGETQISIPVPIARQLAFALGSKINIPSVLLG